VCSSDLIWSLWESYIRSKQSSKKRENKLKDPGTWSADHVLEILSLAGIIHQDEFDCLIVWKAKRNKVVHSGVRVSEGEASQCLAWAAKVVRDICGVTDSDT
jgi:uncharacterized protein YutE (UPF0331/DUF86 family)